VTDLTIEGVPRDTGDRLVMPDQRAITEAMKKAATIGELADALGLPTLMNDGVPSVLIHPDFIREWFALRADVEGEHERPDLDERAPQAGRPG